MKVGMIFECGPIGADAKVIPCLARLINPGIDIVIRTLNNKPNLLENCGEQVDELLKEGCERVVIVWDLYPAWRVRGGKPCRKEDREAIAESLKKAKVTSPDVFLVCIEEELEAWLLMDREAIKQTLDIKLHKVKDYKTPEQVSNPKKELDKIFQAAKKGRYIDYVHAERIARKMTNVKCLKKCPTFVRFALKATKITL